MLTSASPYTYRIVPTPIGELVVTATPDGIASIEWFDEEDALNRQHTFPTQVEEGNSDRLSGLEAQRAATRWVEQMAQELAQYFQGQRQTFSAPLDISTGTPFQRAVWAALRDIPYGETRSYGDIARAIGRQRAVRAVGQANRRNPLAVVVPCHRVIGANGALVGYSGPKIHLKAALLELERGCDGGRPSV